MIKNLPVDLVNASRAVLAAHAADAVKFKDTQNKGDAIAAIEKNVAQGVIAPEVGDMLKKTYSEETKSLAAQMMDQFRPSLPPIEPEDEFEGEELEEAKKTDVHPLAVHTQFVPRGRYNKNDEHRRKAYKVVAVGSKVRGIKTGEHLSDVDLDDLPSAGYRHKAIKAVREETEIDEARHKEGDLVNVSKELSSEDKDHVGKVVKVMGGEVRIQLPTGEGKAHQITVFHHEVKPHNPNARISKAYKEELEGQEFNLELIDEAKDNWPNIAVDGVSKEKPMHFKNPEVGERSTKANNEAGNRALDVHHALHKRGLVSGTVSGVHGGGFTITPMNKKHEKAIEQHVAKHFPGATRVKSDKDYKKIKEDLNVPAESASVEATLQEKRSEASKQLGHTLRKRWRDMSSSEQSSVSKAINRKSGKKPMKEELEADQNIMVHLRKSIDTDGKHTFVWADGETAQLPEEVSKVVLAHVLRLKPEARMQIQQHMQESLENTLEVYQAIVEGARQG